MKTTLLGAAAAVAFSLFAAHGASAATAAMSVPQVAPPGVEQVYWNEWHPHRYWRWRHPEYECHRWGRCY